MGKNLKPVPKGNKGLKKLPTEVRNKMGFMKKGGQVAGPKGYRRKPKTETMKDLGYEPLPFKVPEGKKGDAIRAMFLNRKNIEKKNKGGLVKGGSAFSGNGYAIVKTCSMYHQCFNYV